MKTRKRRPGGGRKPVGNIRGKVENFSTRITRETREALDREASYSGHSISQVAERLLRLGLQTKRERERDNPMRAICFLIDQLAVAISSGRSSDPDSMMRWRTDPFLFQSFKLAVSGLLDRLAPRGEITAPDLEHAFGPFSSPEERASWAVDHTWLLLQTADSSSALPTEGVFADLPERVRSALEILSAQFTQARNDISGGKQ